ncbi:MAG: DNA glycosylase [Candidatus Bathyarchaeia archaeon]
MRLERSVQNWEMEQLSQKRFEISSDEVNGPLNLAETIVSAQTSEPEWSRIGESFTDVELLDDIPVKYTVTQSGTVDDFVIKVNYVGERQISKTLRAHLEKILGLHDDLPAFYHKFDLAEEPLSQTFPRLRGLRLMRGTDPFESLICSILSQNNSALLWNRTARLLMRHYGKKVRLLDGSDFFLFPKPEMLARAKVRELQAKTSMGYRARSVLETSRLIAKGDLKLEELCSYSYEKLMETLLELYGVGPKVADCFILYGLARLDAAPVDVWIQRIVTKLYFKNKGISKTQSAKFLRDRFGEWAGYAQLYLFDFARRVAPTMLKAGKDS